MGGRLYTGISFLHRELNPGPVTHPSTNRARRRLTSLMETNALPLTQTANEHSIRNERHLDSLTTTDVYDRDRPRHYRRSDTYMPVTQFIIGLSTVSSLVLVSVSTDAFRRRRHNRELTSKTTHLEQCSFFVRMLYKDIY